MRLVLIFLGGALAAAGQEDHSAHQNVVAGLGTVSLSTSCSAPAQQLISRGAAMLHSFGYEEARLTFMEAAKADPACGMAHWGVARTWYHPIWAPPSADELKQGAAALDLALAAGAKTARERDYISSLAAFYKDWQTVDHTTRAKAYEQALAQLSKQYPADDEAAIFHGLQLVAVGYLDPSDKTYKWQKEGAAVLNQLLPKHRNHPGVAHYIIHSVDYPASAELGLSAARAYAKIAPDSSARPAHAVSHFHASGTLGRLHRLQYGRCALGHRTGAEAARRRRRLRSATCHGLHGLRLPPAGEGQERAETRRRVIRHRQAG